MGSSSSRHINEGAKVVTDELKEDLRRQKENNDSLKMFSLAELAGLDSNYTYLFTLFRTLTIVLYLFWTHDC